jgi:periplasmic divalent cation tolerance protein
LRRVAPPAPTFGNSDASDCEAHLVSFGVMTKVVTIITTVAQEEDAARIAEMLLREKLAACVQEMTIRSRYRWKNEIQCEPELLLLIKTTGDRAEAAVAAIRKIHPYELPEIIVLPVVGGLADYMNWINVETRE